MEPNSPVPTGNGTKRYPYKEWCADWHWYRYATQQWIERKLPKDSPVVTREIVEYFDRKFGANGDFCRERLMNAMMYVDCNRAQFDVGEFAVVGKQEMAIGKWLIAALWHIYTNCPDDKVSEDWPAEAVLQRAKDMKRLVGESP